LRRRSRRHHGSSGSQSRSQRVDERRGGAACCHARRGSAARLAFPRVGADNRRWSGAPHLMPARDSRASGQRGRVP
jgi:hypothetical protein